MDDNNVEVAVRTAPMRKIVETAGRCRRTKLGIMMNTALECGHLTDSNATDRRRGRMHCWDCYYGRPASTLGRAVGSVIRSTGRRKWEKIKSPKVHNGMQDRVVVDR